jgi:hypothetical protein
MSNVMVIHLGALHARRLTLVVRKHPRIYRKLSSTTIVENAAAESISHDDYEYKSKDRKLPSLPTREI